jgi:hypothetical protein
LVLFVLVKILFSIHLLWLLLLLPLLFLSHGPFSHHLTVQRQ